MEDQDYFGSAYKPVRQVPEKEQKKKPAAFGAVEDRIMDKGFDLNESFVTNKAATYFFRMKGDAMTEAGIFDGDILIVDRSVKLAEGKVIVAILNGELLVRRFHKNFSSAFLIPENTRYKPINLGEFSDFMVWGVVMYNIHAVGA
jgi:DNA polymerase V